MSAVKLPAHPTARSLDNTVGTGSASEPHTNAGIPDHSWDPVPSTDHLPHPGARPRRVREGHRPSRSPPPFVSRAFTVRRGLFNGPRRASGTTLPCRCLQSRRPSRAELADELRRNTVVPRSSACSCLGCRSSERPSSCPVQHGRCLGDRLPGHHLVLVRLHERGVLLLEHAALRHSAAHGCEPLSRARMPFPSGRVGAPRTSPARLTPILIWTGDRPVNDRPPSALPRPGSRAGDVLHEPETPPRWGRCPHPRPRRPARSTGPTHLRSLSPQVPGVLSPVTLFIEQRQHRALSELHRVATDRVMVVKRNERGPRAVDRDV